MSDLLAVDGLGIDNGGRPLVADLGFSVAAGERVGLIGESGSGKSLTALAILGLLPDGMTASGSIRLGGHELIGRRDRDIVPLRGDVVATVFQEPLTALDPLMRIGDQIAEVVRRRARRDGETVGRAAVDDRARTLMARVALPDPERLARAYPHEISGGQRQRAAIAMALACRPRLLIADEPTTALDVTTQADVLRLIEALVREDGMGLMFITHDIAVVASAVDRLLVLREGRAVESGSVDEVLNRPRHAYTIGLIEAARTFDRAIGDRAIGAPVTGGAT